MYSGRFAKTEKYIECEVAICNAKTCLHNESKRCTLKEIAIDDEGKCMQFKTEEELPPLEDKE